MNQLTRILHNLNNYLELKCIGDDYNIYDFEKTEIKDIINAIRKCDNDNTNNKKWFIDRQFLVNAINDWCVLYRCYSLIIK